VAALRAGAVTDRCAFPQVSRRRLVDRLVDGSCASGAREEEEDAVIGRLLMRAVERLLAGITPEEINGGKRCPTYLYRWELCSFLGGATRVYLHKFVGDDWSLDLHDHPKRFYSIGLSGRYVEHGEPGTRPREYSAPWFRSFPAEHRHRLTGPTPDRPCWTLVVVGRPVRPWGFWHAGSFIPWRDYVSPGSAEAAASLSCR
jgi:hypothetical protein